MIAKSSLPILLLLLILAAASGLYVAVLDAKSFGLYYDDGLYVTAGKALATGQGYRNISWPHEQPQTMIPPLYPALLSLVWRAQPTFPDNLVPMMLLGVFLTASFIALSFAYLASNGYAARWEVLVAVGLAALNWRMMLMASTLMSDILCSLLTVAALHLAEGCRREEQRWTRSVVLGLLMGAAFLTRSAGLALLLAVAVYCGWKKLGFKALAAVGLGGIFVIGWLYWSYVSRQTGSDPNAVYYSGYFSAFSQTISTLEELNGSSMLAVLLRIVSINILNLVVVSVPLETLGLHSFVGPPVLLTAVFLSLCLVVVGFLRQMRRGVRMMHIFVLVYLAIHLAVPSTGNDRYLMPLVPFLLAVMTGEFRLQLNLAVSKLRSGAGLLSRLRAIGLLCALLALAATALFSNGSGVYRLLVGGTSESRDAPDELATIDWTKANTDPNDVLICYRDLKYYLYTGRKAVRSFPVGLLDTTRYQITQPSSDYLTRSFLQIVTENRCRYFILDEGDFQLESGWYRSSIHGLVRQNPEAFRPVFRSPGGRSTIYRIDTSRLSR